MKCKNKGINTTLNFRNIIDTEYMNIDLDTLLKAVNEHHKKLIFAKIIEFFEEEDFSVLGHIIEDDCVHRIEEIKALDRNKRYVITGGIRIISASEYGKAMKRSHLKGVEKGEKRCLSKIKQQDNIIEKLRCENHRLEKENGHLRKYKDKLERENKRLIRPIECFITTGSTVPSFPFKFQAESEKEVEILKEKLKREEELNEKLAAELVMHKKNNKKLSEKIISLNKSLEEKDELILGVQILSKITGLEGMEIMQKLQNLIENLTKDFTELSESLEKIN